MSPDPFQYDRIRLVSWDVDGTLFSFLRLATELIKETLVEANSSGWRVTAGKLRQILQFHRIVEKQRRNCTCTVVRTELETVRNGQAFQREAMDLALRKIPPRSSALKLLECFRQRGLIQVALSDFECGYKLQALGLSRFFQNAYSCQQLGFWKPSPVPLMKIQEEYRVSPDEHLHIGDRRDTDGEACLRNGCQFLLI